ncbi:TIR domain-containing protein [Coprococcus sp. AF38-1]|uniref:toll/interleukin-1 receptor domain-containing protein n=1 Tax=Coprococcus sp. AF38-1 TaxID=2302943 RepID=UPI000E7214D9|nr:toll/interleukin-1 receptor domain-containing protein [Coprococcus sp. AF38-1]RJW74125.1 TIR domain-containing protein [Coprococcus sp. AF38-1]
MTRKELQKISLQYRTLASQMLKINSQKEMYCIQQFFDFINETTFLMSYIEECITEEYDFKSIFEEKEWRCILDLPSNQKELISYGFQLIKYILDGPKQLIGLCVGYTSSNKFSDNIEAFMRKSIEPFVVAVRTYIELNFIDADDANANIDNTDKNVFLSYCQKDKDIADSIDEKIGMLIEGKATLSRDIRDVEYHESFKKFMQSIEKHDYVISIISDNYLKSRNCMYEMLEVVKDSNFSQRLLFIILTNEDAKYYKVVPIQDIGADVYSVSGQAKYLKFWSQVDKKLDSEIEEIGNSIYAINQIKEKKIIQKILLDLPDFLEFLRDNKGLSLTEHLEKGFADMISFMEL